jgi:hypothetical protein
MGSLSAVTTALLDAETLLFLCVSALAGLFAAIAMDVVMVRQEHGYTPAYVAAAVLQRVSPDEVSFVDANVVHHAAGLAAGVLYGLLYVALAAVVPLRASLGRVELVPHVVAAEVMVVFIYTFFAYVVLPRAGRSIYEERSTAVRGQWLRSSFVFGVGVVVAAPVLASTL